MKKFFYFFLALLFVPYTHASNVSQSIQIPAPSAQIISKLERFNRFVGKDLEKFTTAHINSQTHGISTVFYPFGGADVLYPLSLFPAAQDIILVGLETPGYRNGVYKYDPEAAGIQLAFLLRRSFFITSQMCQQLSKKTGVISPILLQLSLLGVQEVHLSALEAPFKGIKISFQHNNLQKSITYYQINFHNTQDNSLFMEKIENLKNHLGCLLKATSYIPHQIGFEKIRDFIIQVSKIIIQDDTGIPLKKLKKDFDIEIFGTYTKPYGAKFKCYAQPDLAVLTRKNKNALPFCFGYGCGRQPSTLMLAIKKP